VPLGELVDRTMKGGKAGYELGLDVLELGDIEQARPGEAR